MDRSHKRRAGELAFAAVLAGFSAAALWQAFLISGFSGLTEPGVFPMLAAGAMLVSALFIVRDTWCKEAGEAGSGTGPLARFIRGVTPPRFIAMLAIVTAYLAVMPWLGFVIASGLFLFVSFVFLWRKSLIASLLLALVSLAGVYLVFRVIFQVVLPNGKLIPPGIF